MNKIIRFILGLGVSAICIWFVFRNFDVTALVSSIKKVEIRWVGMAFAIYISAHLLRTIRWRLLIPGNENIKFIDIFLLIMFGFFVNNILPARAGEVARVAALKRKYGLSFSTGLSTVFLERSFDMLGVLVAFAVGVIVSPLPLGGMTWFALFFVGVGSLIFLFLKWGDSFSIYLSKHRWFRFLSTFFSDLRAGFMSLRSIRKILGAALISGVIVILEIFNIWILNHGFGMKLTLENSLLLYLGIILGVSIPAGPGFVGTFELFALKSLEMMGHHGAHALAFVLFLHFYYLVINSGLGVLYLLKEASLPSGKKVLVS